MSAETEGIAQGGIYFSFLWLEEGKIEAGVQFGIVSEMIDRGWHDIMHNTHDAGNGFHYACGAETMSGH